MAPSKKKKTKKPSASSRSSTKPTAREILQASLTEIRETIPSFRGGFGDEPEVKEMLRVPWFPTPMAALNRLLGGGIPGGRWTAFFGTERTGKTTLAIQLIAMDHEVDPEGIWAWFDAEGTFDDKYAASLGVDLARLIPVPAGQIMEDQQDALIKLSRTGFLRGFVVDSVSAYVARQETEDKHGEDKSMRDDTIVAVPRKLSEFFRRATPQIARHKMGQILIGHLYQGINKQMPQLSKLEEKGGNAMKHWTSLRLRLRRGSSDKELIKPVVQPDGRTKDCKVGFKGVITVAKTKQAPTEGQEVEIPFIYGVGFDSVEATIQTAFALGVIEKFGAYYRHPMFPGDKCQLHGKEKTKKFIRENPSVLSKLGDQILSIYDEVYNLAKVGEDKPAGQSMAEGIGSNVTVSGPSGEAEL